MCPLGRIASNAPRSKVLLSLWDTNVPCSERESGVSSSMGTAPALVLSSSVTARRMTNWEVFEASRLFQNFWHFPLETLEPRDRNSPHVTFIGVKANVVLVIVFGGPEFLEGYHLRHDR